MRSADPVMFAKFASFLKVGRWVSNDAFRESVNLAHQLSITQAAKIPVCSTCGYVYVAPADMSSLARSRAPRRLATSLLATETIDQVYSGQQSNPFAFD